MKILLVIIFILFLLFVGGMVATLCVIVHEADEADSGFELWKERYGEEKEDD